MQDADSEDSTSLGQPEVAPEPPKPPPRVRTPEEVAAGLERQKAAINAIRNTPEKRAATRAAAPIEIPSTTAAAGVSTAPVDTSGANRSSAPAGSGGKLNGMFKGNVPSMPSVPGFKSKRAAATAGDGKPVSSAPVEVDPSTSTTPADNGTPSTAADDSNSKSKSAASPERAKSGGRFSGMFKRNSSKGKKTKGKNTAKREEEEAGPDEIELTDQVEQVNLSDEPVLAGEPSEHYPEVVHQVPVQQFPPSAVSSGILASPDLIMINLSSKQFVLP